MTTPEVLQEPAELERILEIFRAHAPTRILEIGTHAGGTLHAWLTNAPKDALVVSVDLGVHREYREAKPLFHSWVTDPDLPELILIQGDSNSAVVANDLRVIGLYDFIFIDGGHSYETVLSDWCLAQVLAAPGAIVAFHDIAGHGGPWDIEVHRVWDEVKEAGYRTEEIVADLAAEECVFGWPQGIGVVYLP